MEYRLCASQSENEFRLFNASYIKVIKGLALVKGQGFQELLEAPRQLQLGQIDAFILPVAFVEIETDGLINYQKSGSQSVIRPKEYYIFNDSQYSDMTAMIGIYAPLGMLPVIKNVPQVDFVITNPETVFTELTNEWVNPFVAIPWQPLLLGAVQPFQAMLIDINIISPWSDDPMFSGEFFVKITPRIEAGSPPREIVVRVKGKGPQRSTQIKFKTNFLMTNAEFKHRSHNANYSCTYHVYTSTPAVETGGRTVRD